MQGTIDGASFHPLIARDSVEMVFGLTVEILKLQHLTVLLYGRILSLSSIQMLLSLLFADFDAVNSLFVELVLNLYLAIHLLLHVHDRYVNTLETVFEETRNVLII